MKNQEIIAKAAIKIGLLTVEEAERRLRNGEDIPLHTIQGWRLRGNFEQPRPTCRTRIPLQPSGFLTSGCFGIAI